MKSNYFLILLTISLFFGCSTPAKRIQKTFNSGEGMIVGTICIKKKIYNGYTFFYADDKPSINDYPNEQGNFTYKYDVADFKKKRNTYYLFSISKPKGSYKFFKIKIFNNSRNNVSTIEIPINMKFEIEEGKTTYFGQLNVDTKKKVYTAENQIERDRTWFAKKAPQIQF
jgi:hypothetical protein